MTHHTSIVIHHDADALAEAVAARLVTKLAEAQDARGHASVVLTGGRVGIATLAALRHSPASAAVDWSALDIWWGDERFLPPGDPERNETQAREALLDHVPVDPMRVHPMVADADPYTGDPEAAAEQYAAELAAATPDGDDTDVPEFDVLLLGVGPDGHVASLFPEFPALYDERSVVAVHGAPKPPPTRLSLTLPAIRAAAEVWLVVAGDDKAPAVQIALGGAGPVQIPAAGTYGRHATLWLLDQAAAAELPPGLNRRATP
ncbi:6-phosphogluconolactonase [Actinobacteria bacterium YIM 96077]|uniref:6-phosphogluconolactonase n=1 Tax=Phytoactinopolyspora halophila TaxID=1981511 RepID=A0A329QPI5_9ACTN|nr:6-phosphogluconolactonase [Phytoactinopolyspora halophila]AYY12925.1 6-phosphogluconolactonase [Actinobacteria bacterium YIM 96077]RAW13639.1 6-phosphogluconolactonase [Phytoactinopolyspora halophila]